MQKYSKVHRQNVDCSFQRLPHLRWRVRILRPDLHQKGVKVVHSWLCKKCKQNCHCQIWIRGRQIRISIEPWEYFESTKLRYIWYRTLLHVKKKPKIKIFNEIREKIKLEAITAEIIIKAKRQNVIIKSLQILAALSNVESPEIS